MSSPTPLSSCCFLINVAIAKPHGNMCLQFDSSARFDLRKNNGHSLRAPSEDIHFTEQMSHLWVCVVFIFHLILLVFFRREKKSLLSFQVDCVVFAVRPLFSFLELKCFFSWFSVLCNLSQPNTASHQRSPCAIHSHAIAAVQIANKGPVWQPLENEWARRLSY